MSGLQLSSSFDVPADTGSQTNNQPKADETNQSGQDQLAAALAKIAGTTETDPTTKTEKPGYLKLFGLGEESDTKAVAAPKAAPEVSTKAPAQDTPAAQQGNQFITDLNDDAKMLEQIKAMQAPAVQLSLPPGLEPEEGGDYVLSKELLESVMSQAAFTAQQQSRIQTVQLVRELIPALIEQANASAVDTISSRQEESTMLSLMEGNEPLQLLAKQLVSSGKVKNGKEAASHIFEMLNDVNTKQQAKLEVGKPQDRSLDTWLKSAIS